MRTTQSFSYFNDKSINREEMKRVLAGDTIPEFVGAPVSYSSVWGMNRYSYMMLLGYGGIGGPSVSTNTGDMSGNGANGWGFGGGGSANTAGTFLASNYTDEVNAFFSALSMATGVNGTTFDAANFLSNAEHLTLLRNLGRGLTLIGIGLNINELIDHALSNSLTTLDFITFGFIIASAISLAPWAAPALGITVGIAGIGFDVYKLNQ